MAFGSEDENQRETVERDQDKQSSSNKQAKAQAALVTCRLPRRLWGFVFGFLLLIHVI